jgi:hypothetical protein
MKKQLFGVLAAVAIVGLLGGAAFALAAKVVVNIPFSFKVEGASYPAGAYEISEDASQLRLRNLETSQGGFVRFITRLSQTPGSETRVVFDKAGDQSYLAEIHIAGSDGYHLQGAPGEHTHVTVKASR